MTRLVFLHVDVGAARPEGASPLDRWVRDRFMSHVGGGGEPREVESGHPRC